MSRQNVILVTCTTKIATSTLIASEMDAIFKGKKPNTLLHKCKANEVSSLIDDSDLIISTTPSPNISKVPVVQTFAF